MKVRVPTMHGDRLRVRERAKIREQTGSVGLEGLMSKRSSEKIDEGRLDFEQQTEGQVHIGGTLKIMPPRGNNAGVP
eukprot:SAG11_NODE_1110_length_5824_cov_7.340087_4_plen_77_part_00